MTAFVYWAKTQLINCNVLVHGACVFWSAIYASCSQMRIYILCRARIRYHTFGQKHKGKKVWKSISMCKGPFRKSTMVVHWKLSRQLQKLLDLVVFPFTECCERGTWPRTATFFDSYQVEKNWACGPVHNMLHPKYGLWSVNLFKNIPPILRLQHKTWSHSLIPPPSNCFTLHVIFLEPPVLI